MMPMAKLRMQTVSLFALCCVAAACADDGEATEAAPMDAMTSGPDSSQPSDAGMDANSDAATDAAVDAALSLSDANAWLPDGGVPRGAVRGIVIGVAAQDYGRVRVSAGGAYATLGASGVFFMDDVRAGEAVVVTATARGYSTGLLAVPVDVDGVTNVLLSMRVGDAREVMMPSDGQSFALGENMDQGTLELPTAALNTVYDTPPVGVVTMETARPTHYEAIAAMWVERDGKRERFRELGMMEIRLRQATAELTLTGPATLVLPISTPTVPLATLDVYRLDEVAGVFRPYATTTYTEATSSAEFEISDFGVYAVAEAAGATSCAQITIQDTAGEPLAHAAVRVVDAVLGGLTWTDDTGAACLEGAVDNVVAYTAFGRSDAGLQWLDGTSSAALSQAPIACGAAGCADLGPQMAMSAGARCVRGKLLAPPGYTAATVSFDESAPSQAVTFGEVFCLDASLGVAATFSGGALDCGAPIALAAATQSTVCAEDDCTDLGEIKCCAAWEQCGDGYDGNCDGQVDEGCTCGGVDCADAQAAFGGGERFCCTASDECGGKLPGNELCYGIDDFYITSDFNCVDETVSTTAAVVLNLSQCCRTDDRCGVLNPVLGCLAREDAQSALDLTLPLAAVACDHPLSP